MNRSDLHDQNANAVLLVDDRQRRNDDDMHARTAWSLPNVSLVLFLHVDLCLEFAIACAGAYVLGYLDSQLLPLSLTGVWDRSAPVFSAPL